MIGFMIKSYTMPDVFRWFSFANYVRFSLESSIVTIYGYDRCDPNVTPNYTAPDFGSLLPPIDPFDPNSTLGFDPFALMNVLSFFSGEVTSDTKSIALINYGLEDDDLYKGLGILVLQIAVYRVITYFVLLWKVKSIS